MSLSQILLIVLAAKATLLSAAEETDPEKYRLPELFKPSAYYVDLYLKKELFTPNGEEYSGTVHISFLFTDASEYIALHCDYELIRINKITFENAVLHESDYEINNITSILTIHVGNRVTPFSLYDLSIEYSANLSSDLVGLYKSSYISQNGNVKYLLATQLAPTYARRVFPCFDEPALKATFSFSITFPNGLNVLFNTQEQSRISNSATGLTTVSFKATPKMSTYLVGFIVSEFTCTTGAATIPFRVCSRDEFKEKRGLAVDIGPQILRRLDFYTDFEYGSVMDKIDMVAIPDFSAGAMENWGLTMHREADLLYDENEASAEYKQEVVLVVAHELVHQWFGNLVTFNWWSEIFMNEGVATYFQASIPHMVLPRWELPKQFVVDFMHLVLVDDGYKVVHSLSFNKTVTPSEIESEFSKVSYFKGGSIIRMVRHFMGSDSFKKGIRNYIKKHQFGNVESEDLWEALNETIDDSLSKMPANLSAVMQTWVQKPGYPLVSVSLSGRELTLSQSRFLYFGEPDDTKWYIPISYTTSTETVKFQNTTPDLWLTPVQVMHAMLPQDAKWIILNNQQTGYYRVNYDEYLWNGIKEALLSDNFGDIPEMNRANIVDDLFNLASAAKLEYSFIFNSIRFLKKDTSYYSWKAALGGFEFLFKRLGEYTELGRVIALDVLDLMDNLYLSVPFANAKEDEQLYTHKQVLALNWACRLGHEGCVEEALTLFNTFRYKGIRPRKDLRYIVYCNGLRYSNDSSDWDFMWNVFTYSENIPSELEVIRKSLGCTRNTTILKQYIDKTVTNGSEIRSQDTLQVFTSVGGNSEGVDVAFDFLIENQEYMIKNYQTTGSLEFIFVGIAERFTSHYQLAKLRHVVETGGLIKGFKEYGEKAVKSAEASLIWIEDFEEDLRVYYNISTSVHLSYIIIPVVTAFLALSVCSYLSTNHGRRLRRAMHMYMR